MESGDFESFTASYSLQVTRCEPFVMLLHCNLRFLSYRPERRPFWKTFKKLYFGFCFKDASLLKGTLKDTPLGKHLDMAGLLCARIDAQSIEQTPFVRRLSALQRQVLA